MNGDLLADRIFSVLALVFMLVGATAAAVVVWLSSRGHKTVAHKSDERLLQVRLQEMKEAIQHHKRIRQASHIATSTLTFGQYIVGGILASAFVQNGLPPQMVSILGLLVLLSSLIHHHFRPDIHLRASTERLARLKALLRHVEDDLETGEGRSDPKHAELELKVLRRITNGLCSIDLLELAEMDELPHAHEDSGPHEQSPRRPQPAQRSGPPAHEDSGLHEQSK
jgi:hypothetical protein